MDSQILLNLRAELGAERLMAVSKTRSFEEVKCAYDLGQRLFGENHVQEIVQKFSDKTLIAEARVELIGHLQSNKVKKAVLLCDRIDSVDSLKLATLIDKEAKALGKIMPILIEVNESGEDAKSGFESEQAAFDAIKEISKLNNIRIEGFMTIGPVLCEVGSSLWEEKTRSAFRRLKEFSIKCQNAFAGVCFKELSMGMTHDYKIAIKEGSTMVRVGTLIFGKRDYN